MLDFKLLKTRALEKSLNYSQISEITGVPLNTINKLFAGINDNPTGKVISPILNCLNLRFEDVWLDDTTGERLSDTIHKNKFGNLQLLEDINNLNARQQETIKNVIKAQLGISGIEKITSLKLFNEPACAGKGDIISSENYEIVEFTNAPKTAKFAIKAQGSSMTPLIENGDILFINPEAQLLEGEIGVFTYKTETFVKQLKLKDSNLILHSLNPKFDDIVINNTDDLFVCGRVL